VASGSDATADARPAAIDAAAVSAWLTSRVPGTRAPHVFDAIAGGRSNLTFVVTDAGGRRMILRRPPLGPTLPSAHDVGREYRIVAALQDGAVPVPPALAFCEDPGVTGAPFAVTGHVEGLILGDAEDAEAVPEESRRALGLAFADTLAALHAIDPAAVGLADLGRGTGHVERQLRRWKSQLDQSRTRDLALLDEVHRRLAAAVPPQRVAIAHGDYRLENMIVSEEGEVRAVLDWELCTLGDPLTDLGYTLVWWIEPGEPASHLLRPAPSAVPGFPTREEIVERYARTSGADVSSLEYYRAFGLWRLACIVEGVYARYRSGAMGEGATEPELRRMADQVMALGEAALRATEA